VFHWLCKSTPASSSTPLQGWVGHHIDTSRHSMHMAGLVTRNARCIEGLRLSDTYMAHAVLK
jgi:hypothetical protein